MEWWMDGLLFWSKLKEEDHKYEHTVYVSHLAWISLDPKSWFVLGSLSFPSLNFVRPTWRENSVYNFCDSACKCLMDLIYFWECHDLHGLKWDYLVSWMLNSCLSIGGSENSLTPVWLTSSHIRLVSRFEDKSFETQGETAPKLFEKVWNRGKAFLWPNSEFCTAADSIFPLTTSASVH